MLYFNDMLLGCIYLLFPLAMYFFYIAHNNRIEAEENNIFLCLALFSSMYLLNLQSTCNFPRMALLLSNIPIIIAMIKNRFMESLFLIMYYIICAGRLFNIDYGIILLEYFIYLLIYFLKVRGKFGNYTFISFFFTVKTVIYILRSYTGNNFFDDSLFDEKLYITIPLTYITSILVLYIMSVGDDIIRYHISYKELTKDKQIKTSLFKITHEIKNPLAVCKGYLDMLDVNNMEQTRKYIPIIKNEVDHTLLILKDFSSYSKISIEKEPIDISYLVMDVSNSFNELLNRKNIKLILEDYDEIIIEADYKRLMQVFINIMKNSIESFDNKEVKIIKIFINEDKKSVTIIVEDTGCGIEDIDRIKEPFYTTKEFGTGLGVSFSNEIILAHGGTLKYESEFSKGTRVIIKLPKK